MTDVLENIIADGFPYGKFDKPPASAQVGLSKRFELGALMLGGLEDQTPTDILHLLKSGWHELERIDPGFFVGATVFGSIVKGRLHQKSDIDMCVFINTEFIPGYEISASDILIIHELLGGALGKDLSDSNTEDIQLALPIIIDVNHRTIKEEVDMLCQFEEKDWSSFLSLISAGVSMFFFDLGSHSDKQHSTLRDMRRTYLQELEVRGEAGDYVFQRLMTTLREKEEFNRNAEIYLPPTIDIAKKYWNL